MVEFLRTVLQEGRHAHADADGIHVQVVIPRLRLAQLLVDDCLSSGAKAKPTLALGELHDSQAAIKLFASEGELIDRVGRHVSQEILDHALQLLVGDLGHLPSGVSTVEILTLPVVEGVDANRQTCPDRALSSWPAQ